MPLGRTTQTLSPESAAHLAGTTLLNALPPHDDIAQLIDKNQWDTLRGIVSDHLYSHLVSNTNNHDLTAQHHFDCDKVKTTVMYNYTVSTLGSQPEHRFTIKPSVQLQSATDEFLENLKHDGMKYTGGSAMFSISAPTAEELLNAINSALGESHKFMTTNLAIPEKTGEPVIRGVDFASRTLNESKETGIQRA